MRIVHCFRSPVGGIFRHVRDLIEVQASQGHQIGILCDSSTGGSFEDKLFEAMKPDLALGLHRIKMRRGIGPSDLATLWNSHRIISKLKPDILHSHGAKGGAYARLVGTVLGKTGSNIARLYCPHGGSIHFEPNSAQGRIYFMLEKFLERSTDRLIFVSAYERDGYFEKIGKPRCPHTLVYNGLKDAEFEPVTNNADAVDFLYIGMMRDLKGPDLFIEALGGVEAANRQKTSAIMVGDGPDLDKYIRQVNQAGLNDRVKFLSPMPAREAFATAKVVVVPSRAESMPYIVLEAIAAAKPLVVTNVGGIPEIFPDGAGNMVEADNAPALAKAMATLISDPKAIENARSLSDKLRGRFSVAHMATTIEQAYRATIKS